MELVKTVAEVLGATFRLHRDSGDQFRAKHTEVVLIAASNPFGIRMTFVERIINFLYQGKQSIERFGSFSARYKEFRMGIDDTNLIVVGVIAVLCLLKNPVDQTAFGPPIDEAESPLTKHA
jgi:hypothetical protein